MTSFFPRKLKRLDRVCWGKSTTWQIRYLMFSPLCSFLQCSTWIIYVGLKWPPKIKRAQTKRCSSQFQQILTDNGLADARRQHSIAHCSTLPMNSAWIISDKAAVPDVKDRAVCHHSWFPFSCGCGDENVFGKRLISPDGNGSELWENCDGMLIQINVMAIKGIRMRPSCGPGSPRATRKGFLSRNELSS